MLFNIEWVCIRELDKIYKETRDVRALMHMAGFVELL